MKYLLSFAVILAASFSHISVAQAAAPMSAEFGHVSATATNRIMIVNDSAVDYDPKPSDYTVTINAVEYPVIEIATGGIYVILDGFTGFGGTLSSGDTVTVSDDERSWSTGATYNALFDEARFVLTWGTAGSGDGQFNFAGGVYADGAGSVWVSDTGNGRVQKFDEDGNYISQFGSFGAGDGQFIFPWQPAVDSSGNFYFMENGNSRVQKVSATGTFIAKWGSAGSGDGQFNNGIGIALDSDGNVYVTDQGNNRVQKFDPSGAYLAQWGGLNAPIGIVIDSDDTVYVADTGNNQVKKFDTSGTLLDTFSVGASPFYMTLDPAGEYLYVVHTTDQNVRKIDVATGSTVSTLGEGGTGDGQLLSPQGGLTFDADDNLYVADSNSNRVQKYHTFTYAGLAIFDYAGGASSTIVEGGDTDTFSIYLTAEPSADVTVDLSLEDGSRVGLLPSTLVFTSADWNVPQTVTLTAETNNTVDGTKTDSLSFTLSSSDSDYDGQSQSDVLSIEIQDTDRVSAGGGLNPNSEEIPGMESQSVPAPKAEAPQSETPSVCAAYLASFIKEGAVNNPDDVKKLEVFLNTYEKETLAENGIYEPIDQEAVKRFQKKYASDVLAFWNLSEPTGYVYLTTARKINAIVCQKLQPTTCPAFPAGRLLTERDSDPEVPRIKAFLNEVYPALPKLDESEVFDAATVSRVKQFQAESKERILSPWNLSEPTGQWYKTTRRAANRLVGCFEPPVRLENGAIAD